MRSIPSMLFLTLLLNFHSYAQSNEDSKEKLAGRSFMFKESISHSKSTLSLELPKVDTSKTVDTSNLEFAPEKGDIIKVLYESDGKVFFKYWYFKDNTDKQKKYNQDRLFSVKRNEFDQITQPIYNWFKGVAVGAYTIPFRLRGCKSSFDFESSLSLQTNLVFGFGFRKVNYSFIDVSVGIGLSSINLTSSNTNNTVTVERTASAFTASLGAVVKPSQFANLGVFLGSDFLGAKDRDTNWIYKGKLWVGLGLNISFNQIKTEKSASGNKQ